MIDITINQYLGLITAIAGILPSVILIKMYYRTKITDYLLFGLFFCDGILVLIFDVIAGIENQLLFFQLHHWTIDIAYLILFIHACRMVWKKIPRIVLYTGVIYYFILFIMTLLWQVFPQPDYGQFLIPGFYVYHSFSTYFPEGAGLQINGIIIYSTGFRYIGEVYRLFCLSFLLYAYYFKARPFIKSLDEKIIKARKIWLFIWILFYLHALSLFFPFDFSLVGFILVIAGILIFYIAIFLPEGLLLSTVQLTRILPLYNFIISQSEKNPGNATIESIKSYLEILSKMDEN